MKVHAPFPHLQATGLKPEEIVEDEEFFDIATSTSPKGYPKWVPPPAEGKRVIPTVKSRVDQNKTEDKQPLMPKRRQPAQKRDKNDPNNKIRQNKTTGKR